MFHVEFSNLPSTGGPFRQCIFSPPPPPTPSMDPTYTLEMCWRASAYRPTVYHIHDQPVPDNGNCTGTLAHLDPYQRGETPACDPTIPETCQVGDLAGKHGKVELTNSSDTFTATYTDNFASTLDGIGAFFGNRSFVFHFGNTTRITCANFQAVEASSSACSSGAPTTTTGYGATATGATATTRITGRPTASGRGNSTTTASTTFVTAAAHTNAAKAMVAMGAAGLAFLL